MTHEQNWQLALALDEIDGIYDYLETGRENAGEQEGRVIDSHLYDLQNAMDRIRQVGGWRHD